MAKITIVCAKCGSSEVRGDAEAVWDIESQQWETVATCDHFTCNSCEDECNVKEIAIL